MQRETSAFVFLGDRLTVSGPPTDGQPGGECFETRPAATRNADVNLRAQEKATGAGPAHSAARTTCFTIWGPTLEMSGGLKRAQHALERPLDRRVGPQPGGGECFAHLPLVARQACAASAVPKRRGLRSPAKHPDQQRARFKRRPCFACSEPDGPPAGRRRTDSPACLERDDGRRDLRAEPLSTSKASTCR